MNAAGQARAVIEGGGVISVAELRRLAGELRSTGHVALVDQLLTMVARRALDGRWNPEERAELAMDVLRDHQQFRHARRLLGRVRRQGPDSERLRQQHALCTYKDLELPAGRRLDLALRILEMGGPLEASTDAETLGIAGAIYKRRWEVDAKRVDLENALWCYRRGFAQQNHPERWYAGINAAFVADRLAALEYESRGGASEAQALRGEADNIRAQIVEQLVGGDQGWNDATRGEALFGLGRFQEAQEQFAAVASNTQELWRQETTATQLATLAALRGFANDPEAQQVLATLVRGNVAAADPDRPGRVVPIGQIAQIVIHQREALDIRPAKRPRSVRTTIQPQLRSDHETNASTLSANVKHINAGVSHPRHLALKD